MPERIDVKDGVHLSRWRPDDKAALVEHLAHRSVYENTCAIPFPYTEEDAARWLDRCAQEPEGGTLSWALREANGFAVGGFGLSPGGCRNPRAAELGYWLAEPWRGRGLATAAVRALLKHALGPMGLMRVEAVVFEPNAASARVLEKNRFLLEGRLKRAVLKDGEFLDARLYARVLIPA